MNARAMLDRLLESPDSFVLNGRYVHWNWGNTFTCFNAHDAVLALNIGSSHGRVLDRCADIGPHPSPRAIEASGLAEVGHGFECAYDYHDEGKRAERLDGRVFKDCKAVSFWKRRDDAQPYRNAIEGVLAQLGEDPKSMLYEFSGAGFLPYEEAFATGTSPGNTDDAALELEREAHFNAQVRAKLDLANPEKALSRRKGVGSSAAADRARNTGFTTAAAYHNARQIGDGMTARTLINSLLESHLRGQYFKRKALQRAYAAFTQQ